MGHVVDPMEYNKAWRDEKWVRQEYMKALPWLNILSSPRAFGQVDEDEVIYLRRRVQELEREQMRKEEDMIIKKERFEKLIRSLLERIELLEAKIKES